MKIEVKPYEAGHGIEIVKNLMEPNEKYFPEAVKEAVTFNFNNSKIAYTLFIDGVPVLCGGVFESWQGVGDAWMFISKKAKETPILIIKKIKAYMLQIIKKEQFKRLHAIVINDFPEGERLMKVLGFTCETPNGMKNYGPNGETCKLFSIVMEG